MSSPVRPPGFCRSVWAALLICLTLARGLPAQEPAPSSDEPGDSAPRAATVAPDDVLEGEVLPKIFLLKDKDGKLQPMPGMGFEDFMEAWKQKQQLDQPVKLPAYSVQKLSVGGTVSGTRAELLAEFTISVMADGWVGVPLRLNESIVREPVMEGDGEHVLDFDPARDGYIVWIRSQPGQTHQVRLKLLTAVLQVGPESTLRLNLPRAAVANMQLRVPVERADAKVSEGCTLESARALEGGSTELNVAGLGGQCEVSWHAADAAVAAVPTVLESTGALNVRINGRTIHTEAKLTVRSLGGEFDRFQVRLPPGADYVGTPPAGTSLVAIDAAAARGKTYEVKLNKKTSGPVEVPLATERVYNSSQGDAAVELGGFEVLGAVRQSGTVAVKVEGNWQLIWGEANQATPVDDLDAVFRRNDLTAGFEYFAQPFTLAARIVSQQSRVRVQPEYILMVSGDEAQLSARLKCTIRGAKVRSLEIDLPGWEVDVVGPGNLVNVDAVATTQTSPLIVPLLQATSGELELTLEAHRKLSDDKSRLLFELPRPRAETVSPATVAVLPADNIELTVDPDRTVGLAGQTTRPQMKLPERLQDPLYFRTAGPQSALGCAIRIHEQSITASVTSQLEVDEQKTQVNQRVALQIAYEPTDHLTLGIPKSLRADRLTITLDGQRLSPATPRDRPAENAELVPMRFQLPASRIGRCEVLINYLVRYDKLSNRANTRVVIPLVMPGEGQLTANDVSISAQSGVSISLPTDASWSQEPRSETTSDPGPLMLSARRALSQVTLALSSRKQPIENAPTVERAWIQTRFTGARRQDRAVFRLRTGEPRVQIVLPAGIDVGLVDVQLDGRRVAPDAISGRDLTISLNGALRGEHVIALSYPFAERQPPGALTLEAPQIKGATWIQESYWQLLLPPDEHLLSAPDRYTREFHWRWSDYCWAREPSWSEAELENWSGAAAMPEPTRAAGEGAEGYTPAPPLSAAGNAYLFSSVGSVEPLALHTASRARLVLWASLPILLCGLAFIYFPVLRHPAAIFALALLVLAAGLIDSEAALLLAQASTLGVGLAVVAALLARTSLRPVVITVPVRGSSKALIERGTTEIYHRAPSGSSPASTSTDPMVSLSLPENEA